MAINKTTVNKTTINKSAISKRTIIIAVVVVILLLAGAKTLKRMGRNYPAPYAGYNKSSTGGFSAPESAGLPSGSLMSKRSNALQQVDTAQTESPVMEIKTDKKVIKNGEMNLKVSRAEDTAKEITAIAKDNGGEVFASNFYQVSDSAKNGNITVKVPVNNFEKTFEEIKKTATLVVRESTSGMDVTEEYTDLQGQLKNKRAEEEAFVKILDQSGKIDDILAVTREIARVRGEIEMLEGRIRFMDSQTDMATINVSLSEDPKITVIDSWRPWQIAKDAFNDLIKNIQQFVNSAIVFIIKVIPTAIIYLVVLGIIYWVGRKIYDRFKKNKV